MDVARDRDPIPPWIFDCDPDLGFFIRRQHELMVDNGVNIYAEVHEGLSQVCFRAAGGDAAFWQQCGVYISSDQTWRVPSGDPQWVLGGPFPARADGS